MSSFDPSAIADIGGSGPDVAGSMGKAFQLKDLMDTSQFNDLRLKQQKSEMADQDTAKRIFSTSKLDSAQGIAETAEKLTRAGQPDKAMELRKHGLAIQSGELEVKLKQIDLHAGAQDIIAGGIDRIWTQANAMKEAKTPDGRPKYTDASINAFIMGQVPAEISSIQTDPGLPDDVKAMALENIHKHLASGAPITYDTLTQFEQVSKQGQAHIKGVRENLAAQMGIKNVESEIAHRGTEERQSQQRIDLAKQNAGSFSGDRSALLAALVEKGVPLPAGFRSKAQQQATLDGLIARNPGKSVDEIAELVGSGQINFGAERKETQTAAATAGRVAVAQNEIKEFVPLVRESSSKVPRGQFVPVAKLLQMGDASISDPNLKDLKIKINSLLNAYDMLAARGGTDKNKREEAHQLLTSADSAQALEAGLKAFTQEADAAERAAQAAEKPRNARSTAPAADPLGIR